MALLTKQQFIEKHGYDPETKGLKPVKKTAPTSAGVSGGGNPSIGFTTEELDAMEKSSPVTSKGFTTEELDAMEKGIMPTEDTTEPKGLINRWTQNEAATSRNVKKGEGSGREGRRTFGETLGNIGNSLQDIGTGIGKSVIRTGVGLAQVATPDAMFGENSLLNSESEKAQQFNQAAKGKGTFQKIGATAADLGMLFAPVGPAGLAGKAAEYGAKAIPSVAKASEGVGTLAKIARATPGLARGAAEGIAGGAIGGQDQNIGRDIAFGVGTPLAIKGLKGIYNLANKTKVAEEAMSGIKKGLEEGDSFTKGHFNQAQADTKDTIYKAIKSVAQGSATENKFAKAAFNIADEELKYGDNALSKDDLLKNLSDEISKEGGLAGIQDNGKFATENLKERISGVLKELGKAKEQLIRSSRGVITSPIKAGTETAEVMNSLDNLRIGGEPISVKHPGLVQRAINGGQMSPIEAFDLSKALRDHAYSVLSEVGGTNKAQGYSRLARMIDSSIESLPDLGGTNIKQLNAEMRKRYALNIAYDALAKVKAPDFMSPGFFGKLAGATAIVGTGFGPMSIITGVLANETGETAAKWLNRINLSKITPTWYRSLLQAESDDAVKKLLEQVSETTLKNVKNAADEKAAIEKAKDLAKKFEQYKASKQVPKSLSEYEPYNSKLDTIDYGKSNYSPKKSNLPSVSHESSPNVFAPENAVSKSRRENKLRDFLNEPYKKPGEIQLGPKAKPKKSNLPVIQF